jgi:hypothetical protein
MTASPNVDLVRSIFAAWERGDYRSATWAHPGLEYVIADGPSPGTWKGLAGMAEGARALIDAWEGYHSEVDEYRELDDERVLVRYRLWTRQDQRTRSCAGADRGSEPVLRPRRQGDEACQSTGTPRTRSPTSASLRRAVDRVREPRPRALDLRGLGTR